MSSAIRPATPADLALLAGIEAAADTVFTPVFGTPCWGPPPEGAVRAARPGFLLVAAEQPEGAAIGFVHVVEHDGGAHLEQLSVHPAHARRGHGRSLVEAALDQTRTRGHGTLTLRTYADVPWNAPFYRSLGFEQIEPPHDDFTQQLLTCERQLDLEQHGARVHLAIAVHAAAGMQMDADSFEQLVVEELDALPDNMVDGLDNVVFVVEDRPDDGTLDLLGLYDGLAVTERGSYGMGELPDRIVVYRESHLAQCRTVQELRDEVHTTLVHEIAHYYGIDDAQLHELGWA